MAKVKMTVTRILAEIKTYDHRIAQYINEGPYLGVARGEERRLLQPQGYANAAALEESIRSANKRLTTVLENRARLREALIQANSTTSVTVGGTTRTVSQTVEYKRSVVPLLTHWINTMKNVSNHFNALKANEDASLESTIERQATAMAAAGGSKTVDPSLLSATRESLQKSLRAELVDPLTLSSVIAKRQEELEKFVTEVDYALSEINAKTEVEIELVD